MIKPENLDHLTNGLHQTTQQPKTTQDKPKQPNTNQYDSKRAKTIQRETYDGPKQSITCPKTTQEEA